MLLEDVDLMSVYRFKKTQSLQCSGQTQRNCRQCRRREPRRTSSQEAGIGDLQTSRISLNFLDHPLRAAYLDELVHVADDAGAVERKPRQSQ